MAVWAAKAGREVGAADVGGRRARGKARTRTRAVEQLMRHRRRSTIYTGRS